MCEFSCDSCVAERGWGWHMQDCRHTHLYVYTEFIRMNAAATINFKSAEAWHLLEGGYYSRVEFILYTQNSHLC